MPFRQIHRLTSAKLMSDTQAHFCKVNDFYWISNNYPSFFSLFTPKNSKNRLLLARVPPCLQPCLAPPCPRSSLPPFPEVFFRAPAEGSLPRPPFLSSVLTVHNPQPPFCLHFSCPYVSLSICAFWLSHFYSFTPSSLLSCPPIQYAYSCVLLFSPFFLSSFSLCPPVPPNLPLPSKCIKFHFSHHVRYRNTPILLHTIISFMKIYWRFKI